MMLTDLADACRKSGLRVVERPGWRTRGHGRMTRVESITCHHDVSPARLVQGALGYIEANALSQLTLARDGTVYVVAAGLCYHAGVVHHAWMGNAYAIGIEAAHTGSPGDPWPGVQYAAYVRLVGALSAHYRVPLDRCLGHKEVARPTGRKSDPTFDMNEFRQDVRNYLSNTHKVEDEDMPLTAEEKNEIAALTATRVWHELVYGVPAQDLFSETVNLARGLTNSSQHVSSMISALAPMIGGDGNSELSEEDVRRVAEAVQRLDAKAVAEQLAVVSRSDA